MRSASQLVYRGFILFLIGTLFTFVLNVLQTQRHSSPFHHNERNQYSFLTKWWLPLICGLGSALVGLIYPCLKYKCPDQEMRCQDWSHVLRCVAMFVGINEACTKVDFPSNLQLCLSLAVISIGMWWYFDRTTIGFGIGVIAAVLATLATQILVYHKICIYSEREFSYVKSWLPCVVFSGGITVANIGKQLAANDFSDGDKSHAE
ncbi:insulin-induced gene 1 protein-like [Argiope bruennichi]|uniref:insulin-induced gene 1 protein-like n=1 Tax=Argiope bruennichi TaxID=94029 RepID=UPI002495814B|nr:insulin-induced gene 1 protein-like [Argiope bruennichi]XP_055924833.1 insulin-induced gene 1 protein-like [Argiope bruennichi]